MEPNIFDYRAECWPPTEHMKWTIGLGGRFVCSLKIGHRRCFEGSFWLEWRQHLFLSFIILSMWPFETHCAMCVPLNTLFGCRCVACENKRQHQQYKTTMKTKNIRCYISTQIHNGHWTMRTFTTYRRR